MILSALSLPATLFPGRGREKKKKDVLLFFALDIFPLHSSPPPAHTRCPVPSLLT